ncbi:Anti-sigma-B factor antagonist [compost metagenome]
MNAPKFQLQKEITEDTNTLYLIGDLDLSQATEMRNIINPLVAESERNLVINMQDLNYIDSTGIGVILSILKARDVQKAPLRIESIPPKIKRLFDITGLTPFLTSV